MKQFSFGKLERLHKHKDIRHVFSVGLTVRTGKLKLFYAPSGQEQIRSCIVVPLKSTNRSIILRNRIKRLIRETIRLNKHSLQANYDIIILFSPFPLLKKTDLQKLKQQDIQEEFLKACQMANLIKK